MLHADTRWERLPSCAWAILALLFAVFPVSADDTKPRTDLFGDPLPKGAVARLGTMRWRHPSNVTFIAYVSDGKELLTSCGDGWIHIWDVKTGKERRRLGEGNKQDNGGLASGIGGVGGPAWMAYGGGESSQTAVSNDGKTLAISGADGKLHIWDIASGKELRSFVHSHPQGVSSLVFTPDGKSLITRGMQDQQIKVWEVAGGKLSRAFNEHANENQNAVFGGVGNPLAISPDGKLLAGTAMEFDNRAWATVLRIWNLVEGKEHKTIKDPAGGARGFAPGNVPVFSRDGKSVAWAPANGAIQLFDVTTGKETSKIGEEKDPANMRMIFTADGKKLAVLGARQTVTLYDVSSGKKLKVLSDAPPTVSEKGDAGPNPVNFYYGQGALALSPDGKTLAHSWGNLVRQWNLETGKGNDVSGGHRFQVQGAIVSRDGKTAVTAAADLTARRWDIASGKELYKTDLPPETFNTLLITPKLGVLRGINGAVRVWDVEAGKEAQKLDAHTGDGGVGLVAASFDGRFAAISTADQTVHIYSLVTGKEVNVIKDLQAAGGPFGGAGQYLYGLDIAPDGSAVALEFQNVDGSGSNVTHNVRMYDVHSGRRLWESSMTAQGQWFNFSNDGHVVAIINADSTTSLLDAATGKQRAQYGVFGSTLMFSDDGRFMAVATYDGAIKLYNLHTAKEIAAFEGLQGNVSWLTFSRDAGLLLSAGSDGTTLVWDISDVVHKARNGTEIDARTAKKLWADLGDSDAAKAAHAVGALIDSPKQALALAAQQLKPVKSVDLERVDKLIHDLDSDEFDVRQKAFNELVRIGGQAAPAMKKALEGDPSLEVRRQIEQLLDRAAPGVGQLTSDTLHDVRAIEVLEVIGTPEAKTVLESLSKGPAGMRVTTEAAAALKRMAK